MVKNLIASSRNHERIKDHGMELRIQIALLLATRANIFQVCES